MRYRGRGEANLVHTGCSDLEVTQTIEDVQGLADLPGGLVVRLQTSSPIHAFIKNRGGCCATRERRKQKASSVHHAEEHP